MKTLAEVMRDAAELPPDAQNSLAGFLTKLRLRHDDAWRKEMAGLIDDRNPANWVTVEEFERQLGLESKP